MKREIRNWMAALAVIASAAGLQGTAPAQADDTEIYQAEAADSLSGRPKVLIVFDDSGSMSFGIDAQRPVYDASETYAEAVPPGRIYWSTNGQVPAANSDNWFDAGVNRCASSYQSLDDNGVFTASRARRFVDSREIEGDCTLQCPAGSVLTNPPGAQPRACYYETEIGEPAGKWVYRQNDAGDACPDGLTYIDPEGRNNDACYEYVVSSDPVDGFIYRRNDTSRCGRLTLLTFANGADACYERVTAPETNTVVEYQDAGLVTVCSSTTIPGEWQALSDDVNEPPELEHLACLDDVSTLNPVNSRDGSVAEGYPRSSVLDGNPFGGSPDPGVDWGNTAYTFYTSHYMDWFYDDSLLETRDRLAIAQDVITTIIGSNPGIDFGLMEFNYDQGGRVVRRIRPDLPPADRAADRQQLIDLVNDMDHGGSTPLCETMSEAYRYLRGANVNYGYNAVSGSDSRGVWDPLPRDTLAESSGRYISPNTDCAYTYVILMTDGFPQRDTGANAAIETLTGKNCDRYEDADGNMTENCLPQLTEYMANTDLDGDSSNGDQFGITYTIGFATDQPLLADAARNGKGQYYTANDAQQLAEAFQGAITSILATDTTFTSPSVAVDTFTRTQSRDEVFYAMFKPSDRTDWIGNIKKLVIDDSASTAVIVDQTGSAALDVNSGQIREDAVTFWGSADADGGQVEQGGVGELLINRDPGGRNVLIDTGTNGALEALTPANVTYDAFGLASESELLTAFGVSSRAALDRQLAWARGYDAYDVDGDGVFDEPRSTADNSRWILGDILHSQPLVINYGARSGYTEAEPDQRIIVGTNAGFVHMFQSDTGFENWAFFPKELAGILQQRRRNEPTSQNVYGMDLSAVAYTFDADRDGTISGSDDKAWVFLGMRRGGSSYYALDVSDPGSPSFMWSIGPETAGFEELGQSWSEPLVTRVPGWTDDDGVAKPVLIIGAGYDTDKDGTGLAAPDDSGRGLFIVDAETGALVWSVTPADNSATNLSEPGLQHAVAAQVAGLDSNGDGLTDRVYFADTGGNVWRVDMPGSSLPDSAQDTWQINKLAALNGGGVASDRRFFSAPDLVRIRLADGAPADLVMLGSGDRTNPNATDVDNRFYIIRDLQVTPYTTARADLDCTDPEETDFRCFLPLLDDTSTFFDITDLAAGGTVGGPDIDSALGWRLDLTEPGEKILATPITLGGKVFVTSFTPDSLLSNINICAPLPGEGRLYVIDLLTGERDVVPLGPIIPDTPAIHIADDGTVRLLLPPGTPRSELPDGSTCAGGICEIGQVFRQPYGNYWMQEQFQ